MLSLKRTQSCVSCNEEGQFCCNGCKKSFCENHGSQHQQSLDEQLDWLTVDSNDLATELSDRLVPSVRDHPSMTIVDRWESEAIARIRQTAMDTRQALSDVVANHQKNIRARLRLLITKLSKASKGQSTFDETQLKQWAAALRNLKRNTESLPALSVHVKDDKPVLVSLADTPEEFPVEDKDVEQPQARGLVPILHPSPPSNDRFEWNCGDVQIHDNGQVVVHHSSTIDASVRGLFKYQSGTHRLLFRIDRMYTNHWIFFGIVSSFEALHPQSYRMPSANGWAGHNHVYVNGKYEAGKNGYRGDMKANDIVQLTLDCNRYTLYLWYSGSKYQDKLTIDIKACPLPWQFSIGLYNANDSVRILPLSMSSIIEREQQQLDTIIRPANQNAETILLWPTKRP